jgi:hypothetical protein
VLLDIALTVVAVVSVVFGAVCYREARKWAKQCRNARIVVAHKRRVKLNAPLVDWLTWANSLDQDESSTGRIVYLNDKTSVAIVRPDKRKKGPRMDERSRATTGVAKVG